MVPLHPLVPAEKPFQVWHLNFKTLSRKTSDGNTSILCCVDNFTCFPIAIPTPDMSALTTAKVFVRDVVSVFGIPENVVSDRGSNFTSQLFKELNKLLGVKQNISATFSARSNGKCESLVKQIGIGIKLYAKDDLTIEQVLPLILMGLRASVNTQTNVSPYEAVFGTVMPLGSSRTMADDSTLTVSMKQCLIFSQQRLHELHGGMKENIRESKQEAKDNYDKCNKVQIPRWRIGQEVLLEGNRPDTRHYRILSHRRFDKDPYFIT